MTETECAQCLAVMAASWPGREMAKTAAMVWAQTLAGLDAEEVMAAITTLRATEEFFPSHARLLAAVDTERRRVERERALTRGLQAATGEVVERPGALGWIARMRQDSGLVRRRPESSPPPANIG